MIFVLAHIEPFLAVHSGGLFLLISTPGSGVSIELEIPLLFFGDPDGAMAG